MFVTFLIEYETFIEILLSRKSKENYCLNVGGNISFNYISHVYINNPCRKSFGKGKTNFLIF